MLRRLFLLGAVLSLVVSVAAPATSVPVTTLVRTIQDVDGDNLLEFGPGEDYIVLEGDEDFRPPITGSIINFLQMTDFQMVDEESPARVEFLDQTQRPPLTPFSAAYRPQESLTTHVAEAMVRAARNTVSPITQEQLDLTILTGDNADSQQWNETRWFIDILDGTTETSAADLETFTVTDNNNQTHTVSLNVGPATKIDPNSGIEGICDSSPDSRYDGVQNDGDPGYYDPDDSLAADPNPLPDTTAGDGQGYSPNRTENQLEVQRDVTVRDFPRLFEAANRPFEALGLDMPWYSAFGNHDALVQGNSHEAYFGPMGESGESRSTPVNILFHQIATGCIKSATLATASAVFPDPTVDPGTMVVPPDPRRCFLAKDEPVVPVALPPSPCDDSSFIQEHFNTTGTPVGHGFELRPPQAVANNDGYYSFVPKPGLRFIVLDTVTDECGPVPVTGGFCSEGSVDDIQFRWLEQEIMAASGAGQYVMVFSHHTLRTTRWPTSDPSEEPPHYGQRVDRENPLNPQNPPPSGRTLEELFCDHSNVIAHIAGHEHQNYLRHHTCEAEATFPTTGTGDFWEISTAAHIDWPQQSRMIELIDNQDATTMSLVLTMLDHAGPPNPGNPKTLKPGAGQSGEQVLKLASIAREVAYNDYQHGRSARGAPTDRNVIIVVDRPWPYPTDDNGAETGGLSLLP